MVVKKQVLLGKVVVLDYEQEKSIVVSIDLDDAKNLCLTLLLLREDLVNAIELSSSSFQFFLSLSKTWSQCTVVDLKRKVFQGSISLNSLEYLLFFLLKYYRDGVGEAEHVDIDFVGLNNAVVTITVRLDSYKEYSSEAIKRMLDE